MNNTCANCRYWTPGRRMTSAPHYEAPGTCRRYPPAAATAGRLPLVSREDWCGEHRPQAAELFDTDPARPAEGSGARATATSAADADGAPPASEAEAIPTRTAGTASTGKRRAGPRR
jgi:hypothetical protein